MDEFPSSDTLVIDLDKPSNIQQLSPVIKEGLKQGWKSKYEDLLKKTLANNPANIDQGPPFFGLTEEQYKKYRKLIFAQIKVMGNRAIKMFDMEELNDDECEMLADAYTPLAPELLSNKWLNAGVGTIFVFAPRIIARRRKKNAEKKSGLSTTELIKEVEKKKK